MRNKGISQHRFKQNPLEEKFAKEWERRNTKYCNVSNMDTILDYMLAEKVNEPNGEVTERDRVVAATVIQWLGSPVGSEFVKSVLGENNETF